ncbi:MAG: ParB/RepB/Spo0J family partition protein [Chloroflexi bacterium]|nr:ParB/RepB/Spo0J family partition protein [Chloroflexota bacterium]
MANRARLTVDDAKTVLSALDRLVGGETTPEISVEEVPLSQIRPNPKQPRDRESAAFSEESLQELASSIAEYGVLQPILLKRVGRQYQIIAGERRYRACLSLDLPTIPARLVDPESDEQELEISLVENLQRKDLDPLEEAEIYRQMLDDLGYTYRSLAERIGKSVGYIDMRVKLLSYDDVRDAVRKKVIGVVEARELARVGNQDIRAELLERIAAGALGRDRLKHAIKDATRETTPVAKKALGPAAKVPDNDLSTALRRCLRTIEDFDTFESFSVEYPELARVLEVIIDRFGQLLNRNGDQKTAEEAPQTEARGSENADSGEPASRTDRPKDAAPVLDDAGERNAIERVRSFRPDGRASVLDRISRYWMALERRGYSFEIGSWEAETVGTGLWRVILSLSIDGQAYEAEWLLDEASGNVQPRNDAARTLNQQN